MSAALVLPLLAGLLVVLVAVVALVVLVVRSRRRAEEEDRPLDPSVIECFPTGYQPPARPGAGGESEPAPGASGPAPGASTGRRSDDPTG